MALLRMAVPALITLVVGLWVGTQIAAPSKEDSETSSPLEKPTPENEGELAALSFELDAAGERIRELEKKLRRASKRDGESVLPPSGIATHPFAPGTRGSRVITSLDEANAAFERALETGDLETMWLLAADVLAFGEEGYPIFDSLFSKFFEEVSGGDNLLSRAMGQKELYMGRFLRTFAEQHEDFLAYGLNLVNRDLSDAPKGPQILQEVLFNDELLPLILGFHGGENPELMSGWLEVLEAKMDEPNHGGVKLDAILFGLAQIPNDRAVDLIASWIDSDPDDIDDIMRALVAHGSERALQIARQSIHLIADETRRAAFEQILGL